VIRRATDSQVNRSSNSPSPSGRECGMRGAAPRRAAHGEAFEGDVGERLVSVLEGGVPARDLV
jgi:hypothetical protein